MIGGGERKGRRGDGGEGEEKGEVEFNREE